MKTNVGVLMGGYSSEKGISLKSGMAVFEVLSREEFNVHAIHILKEGWFVVEGEERFPIDKNDFSATTPSGKLRFDVLFNAIHGTPGEDGLLQAYFELVGIPHTSSMHFESALTFNKAETSSLLNHFGVNIPSAFYLAAGEDWDADEILGEVGLPCFVKPNRSGSSFGVSKVKSAEELGPALDKAFSEDTQVIIEQAITGTELCCGVARWNGEVQPIGITEIVPKKEFFDFEAKYEGAADEITPARISKDLYHQIERESMFMYESLNMRGIARADFIVDRETQMLYLIEVNSVPGLSAESIVPQQIDHLGISRGDFYGMMVREAMK